MLQLFTSGRVLDAVLAIVALEFVALLAIRPLRERCRLTPELLAHLWAAASLLLASHLIITQQGGGYIACALLSALISHILAWRLSWRTPGRLKLDAAR
jgi:hypothetical protein